MSLENRNKLTSEDWKKIIFGFVASFAIYFTLTVISYKSNNCSADNTISDFECLTAIPPYEKIYIVLFSLIFGFFIQEIDDSLYLIGYNIIATLGALFVFYFIIEILTDDLITFEAFYLLLFNFSLVFISSLFGQGLSNVIYSKIKNQRKSKNYKKDYRRFSDIE